MSNENGRDPYLGLLGAIRGEAEGLQPMYFCLGTILSISETSIRIQADGQELDEEDVMINDMLRVNFEEEAEITMASEHLVLSGRLNGAASPCPYGGHSYFEVGNISDGRIHDLKAKYKVPYRLKAGDLVLLIPSQDKQIYYLVMKVVSYGSVSAH